MQPIICIVPGYRKGIVIKCRTVFHWTTRRPKTINKYNYIKSRISRSFPRYFVQEDILVSTQGLLITELPVMGHISPWWTTNCNFSFLNKQLCLGYLTVLVVLLLLLYFYCSIFYYFRSIILSPLFYRFIAVVPLSLFYCFNSIVPLFHCSIVLMLLSYCFIAICFIANVLLFYYCFTAIVILFYYCSTAIVILFCILGIRDSTTHHTQIIILCFFKNSDMKCRVTSFIFC